MNRFAPHYGFRVADSSLVPCVEVTRLVTKPSPRSTTFPDAVLAVKVTSNEVIKRVYGFTTQHAIKRALKWMHEHGDPR